MATTIPHLSLEGFITNRKVIMIKLMEHFLASDYSQSNTFMGQVGSLKYLLEHYRTAHELKRNIIATLYGMYDKHFETIDVMVDVIDVEASSAQTINLDIVAIDFDGEEHTLSRGLQELNGIILNFDELEEELKDG